MFPIYHKNIFRSIVYSLLVLLNHNTIIFCFNAVWVWLKVCLDSKSNWDIFLFGYSKITFAIIYVVTSFDFHNNWFYEKMMIYINGTKLIKLCDNYFWLKYFKAHFFDIEVKRIAPLWAKLLFLLPRYSFMYFTIWAGL